MGQMQRTSETDIQKQPPTAFVLPSSKTELFLLKEKKSGVAFIFLPHKYKFRKLFNFSSWQVTPPLLPSAVWRERHNEECPDTERKTTTATKNVVYDVRNTYVFHFIWALPLSSGHCFHQREETSFLEKSRGEGQIY